jgi:hypothetical protein
MHKLTFGGIGGGDPKKGLEFYSSVMGPESKGLQSLLAKYADPLKLEVLKTTDPDLYNFVKTQLRNSYNHSQQVNLLALFEIKL